jgi:lysyl-tRNA synthetase class 1
VKFSVTPVVPGQVKSLPTDGLAALRAYLGFLQHLGDWKAEDLHNGVYAVAHEGGFVPKQVFSAIYVAFLGEEKGPRLGWFLEALGRDFVVTRLADAIRSSAE